MSALCFAGFVASTLLAVGILIRKGRDAASAPLAALLACTALELLLAALRYDGNTGLHAPLEPFLTPLALIGLMVSALSGQLVRLPAGRPRGSLLGILPLGPALVSDVLTHVFRLQDTRAPGAWALLICLHAVVALGALGLCAAAFFRVFSLFSPETMSGLARTILAVSGTGLAALVTGLAGLALGDPRLFAVMDGFAAVAALGGTAASFRWPEALGRFHEETVARRYAKSLLVDLDVPDLIAGMIEMVRRTGLYRDADCSLEDLARRTGISRGQVSELLNDRMGTNYAGFINGFRVEEAKALLRDRPELSVLAVALEVGFGNKTSFNEAFRRAEGRSPSEYRKEAMAGRQER